MLISEYIIRLRNASSNINDETGRIIESNKSEIYDLVRENQLRNKGQDGDGKNLGFYSFTRESPSFSSQNSLGFPKQSGQPYNFIDTGGIYVNFIHRYSNFELEIDNSDSKINFLEGFYSNSLIGMQEQNQDILNNDYIYPNITKWLKSIKVL